MSVEAAAACCCVGASPGNPCLQFLADCYGWPLPRNASGFVAGSISVQTPDLDCGGNSFEWDATASAQFTGEIEDDPFFGGRRWRGTGTISYSERVYYRNCFPLEEGGCTCSTSTYTFAYTTDAVGTINCSNCPTCGSSGVGTFGMALSISQVAPVTVTVTVVTETPDGTETSTYEQNVGIGCFAQYEGCGGSACPCRLSCNQTPFRWSVLGTGIFGGGFQEGCPGVSGSSGIFIQ